MLPSFWGRGWRRRSSCGPPAAGPDNRRPFPRPRVLSPYPGVGVRSESPFPVRLHWHSSNGLSHHVCTTSTYANVDPWQPDVALTPPPTRCSSRRGSSSASSPGPIPDSEEVTLGPVRALVLLDTHGGLNAGSLAQLLGVEPSATTRLCDRLVVKGLVERGRKESRREVGITLTPAGRALVAEGDGEAAGPWLSASRSPSWPSPFSRTSWHVFGGPRPS